MMTPRFGPDHREIQPVPGTPKPDYTQPLRLQAARDLGRVCLLLDQKRLLWKQGLLDAYVWRRAWGWGIVAAIMMLLWDPAMPWDLHGAALLRWAVVSLLIVVIGILCGAGTYVQTHLRRIDSLRN